MIRNKPRRTFILGTISATTLLSTGVHASNSSEYPKQPVKMIVAFSAGGPIDLAARIIAERLTEKMGQPFVVENRTGANGAIAAELVRTSKADGYTMLVSNASMITITPTLKKDLKYNVERDFVPVTRIASSGMILVVNTDDPEMKNVNSVEDLVKKTKSLPGKLSYGSAGPNGNVQQLAFELFAKKSDLSLLSVPYKGSSEVQVALLSKTISLAFDTLTAIPYIKSGKFRALAVSSADRISQLPDVPTMAELGYKGFDIGFWSGLFMPKGTPNEIVNDISREIVEACKDPVIQARLEPLGTVVASTPGEFQAHIKKETALVAEVIRLANIKPL